MEKIKAPFTKEQVDKLNEYQQQGKMHQFTCKMMEMMHILNTSLKKNIMAKTIRSI